MTHAEPRREFRLRCHPEVASPYDITYLIGQLDQARTEFRAQEKKAGANYDNGFSAGVTWASGEAS